MPQHAFVVVSHAEVSPPQGETSQPTPYIDEPYPAHNLLAEPNTAEHGVSRTLRLNTHACPHAARIAQQFGITLYEPFGGLCAGLEAALRTGLVVHRYLYSDISVPAQNVAARRINALRLQYPHLLPASATQDTFTALPMDVTQCTTEKLIQAGARDSRQWLVIAGPECKDFSPAGGNRGVQGMHAHTLQHCVRIIGTLQQLQPDLPPLFVVENAAMQYNWKSADIRD